MCDLDHTHHHDHFGFLVDSFEIRALIDETKRLTTSIRDDAERVAALLWLPETPYALSRLSLQPIPNTLLVPTSR